MEIVIIAVLFASSSIIIFATIQFLLHKLRQKPIITSSMQPYYHMKICLQKLWLW